MSHRILSVTAYTTLDLVTADIETAEKSLRTDGVVNVSVADDHPDQVTLGVELDLVETNEVATHADRVRLSPTQARSLADDLQQYADEADTD
ncbi:DUF6360 family protein [Haloquadratum walsbyi]|jgi:hypothetical protein|uniref:Uncharacterized protein n=1 Tax=Haloquadratum walsbyi J07HQW2 TaxID=1238425 RepID=U1PL58_9EURY|nr:DUF6360 family protein [Haloquadratum walsbyi]ERG94417.1 MAG: hypothetical protein J07HQW2_00851 [Haloquadratum walsbyi J07HQW2]